jgi:hypothetical protein
MWNQYCSIRFHSCNEKMSSVRTSYLIRYCHDCVWDIHVWSTSGIWNVTACSGVCLLQCFILMWCRQQVPQNIGRLHWNVMAHAQKPDFIFQQNKRVHLNQRGRQFSRLLAAEVCASVVVMLDTPCSEVVWRVLATHSIHQFSLHFPSRASPCAIKFQLYYNYSSAAAHCPPISMLLYLFCQHLVHF